MKIELDLALYTQWRYDIDYAANSLSYAIRSHKKTYKSLQAELAKPAVDKNVKVEYRTPPEKIFAKLKNEHAQVLLFSELFDQQFKDRDRKKVQLDWHEYDEFAPKYAEILNKFKHDNRVLGALHSFLQDFEFEFNRSYYTGIRSGKYKRMD